MPKGNVVYDMHSSSKRNLIRKKDVICIIPCPLRTAVNVSTSIYTLNRVSTLFRGAALKWPGILQSIQMYKCFYEIQRYGQVIN